MPTTELATSELRPGDFVRMVAGQHPAGSKFLIEDTAGAPWITLSPATNAGAPDRRRTGWSGNYADARWDVIRRGCPIT